MDNRKEIESDKQKRYEELERFLADAHGFILWVLHNRSIEDRGQFIAATLAHDIAGLFRREECFSPFVSGYAEKLPDARASAFPV
jgi:hypothetical protein